mgnify:FL=1
MLSQQTLQNTAFPTLEYCEFLQQGVDNIQRLQFYYHVCRVTCELAVMHMHSPTL